MKKLVILIRQACKLSSENTKLHGEFVLYVNSMFTCDYFENAGFLGFRKRFYEVRNLIFFFNKKLRVFAYECSNSVIRSEAVIPLKKIGDQAYRDYKKLSNEFSYMLDIDNTCIDNSKKDDIFSLYASISVTLTELPERIKVLALIRD